MGEEGRPTMEANMSAIIFTCPETGREVSTGIDIDPETYGTLLYKVTEINCPVCKHHHTLANVHARLASLEETERLATETTRL
jgi:hypothetical protein